MTIHRLRVGEGVKRMHRKEKEQFKSWELAEGRSAGTDSSSHALDTDTN